MERQEVEGLRTRLETLERRMRVVVVGWVVSAAVFVLLGVAVHQAVSQPEVLRARRIEVVDTARRLGISLEVFPDGSPLLTLTDTERRERVGLGVLAGRVAGAQTSGRRRAGAVPGALRRAARSSNSLLV